MVPRPDSESIVIWGLHPVREFIESCPEAVERVYCLPSFGIRGQGKRFKSWLKARGVRAEEVKRLLDVGVSAGSIHQGIAAVVKKVWEVGQEEGLKVLTFSTSGAGGPVIACDGVTDPQNFGAIIRGAVALGAQYVLAQRRGSSPVTGAVVKASSGAVAMARILYVDNLIRFLSRLRQAGWTVLGLDPGAKRFIWQECLSGRDVVLVLGSEHKGLRKGIKMLCDDLLSIPLAGKVQSLNVSQAAGIVLYEWLRQKGAGSDTPYL